MTIKILSGVKDYADEDADEDAEDTFQRFHDTVTRRRRKKKIRKKNHGVIFDAVGGGQESVVKIVPTMALPFIAAADDVPKKSAVPTALKDCDVNVCFVERNEIISGGDGLVENWRAVY